MAVAMDRPTSTPIGKNQACFSPSDSQPATTGDTSGITVARISSQVQCIPDSGSVLLGLRFIKDVGEKGAQLIVEERGRNGPYAGAGDLVPRTGLKVQKS